MCTHGDTFSHKREPVTLAKIRERSSPQNLSQLSQERTRTPRTKRAERLRAEQEHNSRESRLQFINTFWRLRTIRVFVTQYPFCTFISFTCKIGNARNDLTFQRETGSAHRGDPDPERTKHNESAVNEQRKALRSSHDTRQQPRRKWVI